MRTRVILCAIFAFAVVVSPISIFQVVGYDSCECAEMFKDDEDDRTFPNVNTISIFPNNSGKVVRAGKFTELLVGVHNGGKLPLFVHAVGSTLHLPFDHCISIQSLTIQQIDGYIIPPSAQGTIMYKFTVSKPLQPGSFDLVGHILVEIDEHPYVRTFYNGTVEVVESGGFLNGKSVLVTIGIGLLMLLGFLVNTFNTFSKYKEGTIA